MAVLFLALVMASVASYVLMDLKGRSLRYRRSVARVSGVFLAVGTTFVLGMSIHKAAFYRGSDAQSSNYWSFGQILSVAMLLLLMLSYWAMEDVHGANEGGHVDGDNMHTAGEYNLAQMPAAVAVVDDNNAVINRDLTN
ncbi:hypothetical protein MY10362_009622 [Beauveria mimosiformis]